MDSSGDCDAFSAPGTLGESEPRFDGSGLKAMLDAALRKSLDLWGRLGALEKWVYEARCGGGPPPGTAPHFAAHPVDYPPVRPALAFVPTGQLPSGHSDFRPLWHGEE